VVAVAAARAGPATVSAVSAAISSARGRVARAPVPWWDRKR
jgi:hypothetical protein